MKFRSLGRTNLTVSAIGLGCSDLGRPLVHRRRSAWIRLLHQASELGINFFDTANTYRHGVSEELLGDAFRHCRDSVVFATKAGSVPSALGGLLERMPGNIQRLRRWANARRPPARHAATPRQDFSAAALEQSVESSLRRLQTDRIDLLMLHNPPAACLDSDETLGALERLRDSGKILHFGVSADSEAAALKTIALQQYSVLEIAFSILHAGRPENVIEQATRAGVGIIARLVLGRGLLTPQGAVLTGPQRGIQERTEKILGVSDELEQFAEARRRSLVDTAILFALHPAGVSCALVGTQQSAHLAQDVESLRKPDLTTHEVEWIRELISRVGNDVVI